MQTTRNPAPYNNSKFATYMFTIYIKTPSFINTLYFSMFREKPFIRFFLIILRSFFVASIAYPPKKLFTDQWPLLESRDRTWAVVTRLVGRSFRNKNGLYVFLRRTIVFWWRSAGASLRNTWLIRKGFVSAAIWPHVSYRDDMYLVCLAMYHIVNCRLWN